jgi:hypothetical protein
MKKIILLGLFLCLSGWGFVPPVSEQLSDIFSGRKPGDAVELTFRHMVQIKEGEVAEVIEQFVGNRQGGVIRYQVAGQPPVYADWNGKEYSFRSGKSVPSRTNAFIDIFLAETSGIYLDRLLREHFVRREQLLQFKPGYQPQGDPKTWGTKENYLLHEDIYLVKVGREFGWAISGMNEPEQRRTVVLAKVGRGVQRLEWLVGTENAAWDCSGFSSQGTVGRLPRLCAMTINGVERVRSTLSSAKSVKKDALATARLASRQPTAAAPPSPLLEEAVRLIVRYR